MRLDRFVAERAPVWQELDALLGRAGRRPHRLGPDGARRLGALYRAAAADLAAARGAFPGDPVTVRLEALVARARPVVYAETRHRRRLRHFLVRGYWRRVLERPVPLAVSAALLFGPVLLAAAWAIDDPANAIGLVPEEFRGAAEPVTTDRGLGAAESAAFSSEILTNNIRVTFLALAGGVLLGLGTAAVLLYNGTFIGALAGIVIGAGQAEPFFTLIAAHGVLELSCIVVSGAAGLRLGWAIVEPGPLSRARSFRREARRTAELVLGTAPWLVLAGIVEGYVTPAGISLGTALAVGFGLGALYWALVLGLGRARPGEDAAEDDAVAAVDATDLTRPLAPAAG